METVSVKLNGRVRRVTLNGRNYLVAPVTMLVSGVLNGSQGPLYYPPEEVERNPSIWNGVPLLLGHPVAESGEHISGRDPGVWANRHLGHVFNVTAEDGKLRGEAWFDADNCKTRDPKLVALLETGKPIEVSTGLFTEDEVAPAGAAHNGESYDRIARNYRPDHLAVLLDEPGACSVADGCGVNVNVWTDAAREAAARARGAMHTTGEKRADGSQTGASRDSGKAATFSRMAHEASQSAKGSRSGHASAAMAHEAAAAQHEKAAAAHENEGDTLSHSSHKKAAEAHRKAAAEHKQSAQPKKNEEANMVDRKKLIASLTANCTCWKKNPAKLNKLTDGQLVDLASNAAKAVKLLVVFNAAKGKANEGETEGEVAGIDIAALAEFLGVAADAASDPVAFIAELKGKVAEVLDKLGGAADAAPATPVESAESDEPTEEEPVDMAEGEQGDTSAFDDPNKGAGSEGSSSSGAGASDMVGDSRNARHNVRRQPVTEQQWLASAPPRIRSIVNSAIARERQERTELLTRIVANIEDDAQRKRLWGRYAKIESLDELRELADLVNPVQPEPVPYWLGSAGGPVGNAAATDEDREEIEAMIPPGFRVTG